MNIEKSYNSTSKVYDISQILTLAKKKKLNCSLDCQRGTVWTMDQKQGLIDTLVCGERVPPIHCISQTNNCYSVVDGKQRISTILSFLNNELIWKKSKADEIFYDLFGTKTGIYFVDLPQEIQNLVYDVEIDFIIYSDITTKGISKLFRKLNNGSPLKPFQKAIANNIYIRNSYSQYVLSHPILKILYSEKNIEIDRPEDHLICLLAMMLACDKEKEIVAISLQPEDILKDKGSEYLLNPAFLTQEEGEEWNSLLKQKATQVIALLDKLEELDYSLPQVTKKAEFVFPLLYGYYYDLSSKELLDLYIKMQNINTVDITSSSNYSKINVERWLSYINQNCF